MTEQERQRLYEKTMRRLRRAGLANATPRAQIIFLAEEIEGYRDKIQGLEAALETARAPSTTTGAVYPGRKKYPTATVKFWRK